MRGMLLRPIVSEAKILFDEHASRRPHFYYPHLFSPPDPRRFPLPVLLRASSLLRVPQLLAQVLFLRSRALYNSWHLKAL